MNEVFYKKKISASGRVSYVPVSEYDSNLCDSFTKGNHLVMSYPGGVSRRFNIDPNYAAMIAAGRVAEDVVSQAIMKASDIRRSSRCSTPLTPSQVAAWENLIKELGPDANQLEWPSAREAAEAAVAAMQAEAVKLMSNPAVRASYEKFQLICQLTKEKQEQ